MQIREHALATPDKPAVILYPSGTVVTFGEMGRGQPVGAPVPAGRTSRRRRRRDAHGEQRALPHRWAARRSGLYYVPINTHLTAAEAATSSTTARPRRSSACGNAARSRGSRRAPARDCRRSFDHCRRSRIVGDRHLQRPGRLAALPGMRCRSTGYTDRRRRSRVICCSTRRAPPG